MICIGIDPGLTGAIAFLNHDGRPLVYDLPTMQRGSGEGFSANQIDVATLRQLITAHVRACGAHFGECRIALEKASAMPARNDAGERVATGGSTMFAIGLCAGMLEACVALQGIEYDLVAPVTWKREFGLLKRTKHEGLDKARGLFPSLAASHLARKKDHGRGDALLLALWARNRYH